MDWKFKFYTTHDGFNNFRLMSPIYFDLNSLYILWIGTRTETLLEQI